MFAALALVAVVTVGCDDVFGDDEGEEDYDVTGPNLTYALTCWNTSVEICIEYEFDLFPDYEEFRDTCIAAGTHYSGRCPRSVPYCTHRTSTRVGHTWAYNRNQSEVRSACLADAGTWSGD